MKTIKYVLVTLFAIFNYSQATKVKTTLKKAKCQKTNLKCNCDI